MRSHRRNIGRCGRSVHHEGHSWGDHRYSQELFCERTGEQIDDSLVPRVTKEILAEIKDTHQMRISERTGSLTTILCHASRQRSLRMVLRRTWRKRSLRKSRTLPTSALSNAPGHDKSMCFFGRSCWRSLNMCVCWTRFGGDRENFGWRDQRDSAGAGVETNRGADCGLASSANHEGDR